MDPLAQSHRLIFFDQRGVGKSGKPEDGDYGVASIADDVDRLRRSLRLGKVHLFGFSWGGALALEVAIRYPESLRSLTVAEGFTNTDALSGRLQSWLANAPRELRAVVERTEREGLFTAEDRYPTDYDDAVGKIYPRNLSVCQGRSHLRLSSRPYRIWPGMPITRCGDAAANSE